MKILFLISIFCCISAITFGDQIVQLTEQDTVALLNFAKINMVPNHPKKSWPLSAQVESIKLRRDLKRNGYSLTITGSYPISGMYGAIQTLSMTGYFTKDELPEININILI